jgi:biopolymer transport protein ExbD
MSVVVLIAYAWAVGVVMSCSAWLLERGLTAVRLPVRWIWLGALALSVWLPVAALVWNERSPRPNGPVGSEVVAAVEGPSEAGILEVEGTLGISEFWLLRNWNEVVSRAFGSGASLLPAVRYAPGGVVTGWGAASLVVLLALLASGLGLKRRARGWPRETLLGRQVRISPDLGPATLGLIAPYVVIPRWAKDLPDDELELVLRHEAEHVRSRDTLVLAVGLAAVVACPWNPSVWWQLRRLKAAVELDCDRRVLRHGVAPAHYATLLVSLGTRGHRAPLAVPTIAGPTSLLERRLTLMKTMRKNAIPGALVAIGLALPLVVVACTTDAPVGADVRTRDDSQAEDVGQAAFETRAQGVVVVEVAEDGTTRVNGVTYPIGQVSEVVEPLVTDGSVASIEAVESVPYRSIAAVQDELREAGLLRVVFIRTEPGVRRPARREVSTIVDDGLAMVLPEAAAPDIDGVNVNPRNLLFLEVLPSGVVAARFRDDPQTLEISPDDVEELWSRGVAENPRLIAVMMTHGETQYRHMYDVLGALRRAEATRFAVQLAEG